MEAVAMLNVLVSFADSFASLRVGCKSIGDSYLARVPFGAPSCSPSPWVGFPSGRPCSPLPWVGPLPWGPPCACVPPSGVWGGLWYNEQHLLLTGVQA